MKQGFEPPGSLLATLIYIAICVGGLIFWGERPPKGLHYAEIAACAVMVLTFEIGVRRRRKLHEGLGEPERKNDPRILGL